jgi:hypothetical protein
MFLNLDEAVNFRRNHPDPLVRAILACVHSVMVAGLPEKRPEGAFDMVYCFETIVAALPQKTLEKILRDPAGFFAQELDM